MHFFRGYRMLNNALTAFHLHPGSPSKCRPTCCRMLNNALTAFHLHPGSKIPYDWTASVGTCSFEMDCSINFETLHFPILIPSCDFESDFDGFGFAFRIANKSSITSHCGAAMTHSDCDKICFRASPKVESRRVNSVCLSALL